MALRLFLCRFIKLEVTADLRGAEFKITSCTVRGLKLSKWRLLCVNVYLGRGLKPCMGGYFVESFSRKACLAHRVFNVRRVTCRACLVRGVSGVVRD